MLGAAFGPAREEGDRMAFCISSGGHPHRAHLRRLRLTIRSPVSQLRCRIARHSKGAADDLYGSDNSRSKIRCVGP